LWQIIPINTQDLIVEQMPAEAPIPDAYFYSDTM
jgi:hypothetical protein